MNQPYLEVTYRQGKPLAAYLYLNRNGGEKAATTKRYVAFLVDYNEAGHPIGIEFPNVGAIDLAAVNQVLADNHAPPLRSADLAPLTAA